MPDLMCTHRERFNCEIQVRLLAIHQQIKLIQSRSGDIQCDPVVGASAALPRQSSTPLVDSLERVILLLRPKLQNMVKVNRWLRKNVKVTASLCYLMKCEKEDLFGSMSNAKIHRLHKIDNK